MREPESDLYSSGRPGRIDRENRTRTQHSQHIQQPQQSCEGWRIAYDTDFMKVILDKEARGPKINLLSPQLKYRGYLILQMKSVSKELSLDSCVLHAAVRLLDLFMDSHDINVEKLLSVAFACLFIAGKFELEGRLMPKFSEICKVAHVEALPKEELLELEFTILEFVKWDLCMPNVSTFLSFFARFAFSLDDYNECLCKGEPPYSTFEELHKSIINKINIYLYVTLLDVQLTLLPPSLLAAACLLGSRRQLGLNSWPKELNAFAIYSYSQIDIIATRLTKMLNRDNAMLHLKRRHQSYEANDDDQGYCSGKSTPESNAKKCRKSF